MKKKSFQPSAVSGPFILPGTWYYNTYYARRKKRNYKVVYSRVDWVQDLPKGWKQKYVRI